LVAEVLDNDKHPRSISPFTRHHARTLSLQFADCTSALHGEVDMHGDPADGRKGQNVEAALGELEGEDGSFRRRAGELFCCCTSRSVVASFIPRTPWSEAMVTMTSAHIILFFFFLFLYLFVSLLFFLFLLCCFC
jgi:hypothetical protein